MEVERAVIVVLKEVFPKSLVGLEVMPGLLPPNLTFLWLRIWGSHVWIVPQHIFLKPNWSHGVIKNEHYYSNNHLQETAVV